MNAIHRQALSHIQNDSWEAAHRLIQQHDDPFSCRIHGYLHRIEGDLENARYWYRRAGLDLPGNSLDTELEALQAEVLD